MGYSCRFFLSYAVDFSQSHGIIVSCLSANLKFGESVLMNIEELKVRQLTNQHLIAPADKMTVLHDLCGVQAQFMGNAMHSLKIRCSDYQEDTIKYGLVKNWTVRGTVHVFAEDDLPLFIHCNNGQDYLRNDWRGYTFWNQRDTWALTPERQAYFASVILKALKYSELTREELKDVCRKNGMTEPEESSMFDQWGGGVREMCERGFINYVVQEKKAFCLSPAFTPIPESEAKLEIARRYFTHMGPATIHDAMYYFHTTAAQVKSWLSQQPVSTAECVGKTYYYIDDNQTYNQGIPKCIFLAGFDQLLLAHEKNESLFLGQHNLRAIFNLAGIVMPSLMIDGKIVGKWKKKNKKLLITMFKSATQQEKHIITDFANLLWNDISSIDIEG